MAHDTPSDLHSSGYVYVLGYSTDAVKVGMTTQTPTARIATHRSAARAHGVEVTAEWFSQRHAEYQENESRLISYLQRRGAVALSGRGEYTTGVAYSDVVKYAKRSLSYSPVSAAKAQAMVSRAAGARLANTAAVLRLDSLPLHIAEEVATRALVRQAAGPDPDERYLAAAAEAGALVPGTTTHRDAARRVVVLGNSILLDLIEDETCPERTERIATHLRVLARYSGVYLHVPTTASVWHTPVARQELAVADVAPIA